MHCLRDAVEYGTLGYCEQCRAWYLEEGEEEQGVYHYCTTKDTEPERCNEFVQSLIIKPAEIQEGKEIPMIDTTIANIRKADQICANCGNKNFVISEKYLSEE
jgi:hypothetical protein